MFVRKIKNIQLNQLVKTAKIENRELTTEEKNRAVNIVKEEFNSQFGKTSGKVGVGKYEQYVNQSIKLLSIEDSYEESVFSYPNVYNKGLRNLYSELDALNYKLEAATDPIEINLIKIEIDKVSDRIYKNINNPVI